jgi:hypothetical protein
MRAKKNNVDSTIKVKISYLQYQVCSDHGCNTVHHYFWEGKLIFIFEQRSYWVGSTDKLSEHRTYFKDGMMIKCLEKEVTTTNGQQDIDQLLKKTSNGEVDCTSDRLTDNVWGLVTLNRDSAEKYFCE